MSSGDKKNGDDDDDAGGSVASYDSFSEDDDFEYRNRRIAKSFVEVGDIFFGTIIKFKPPDLWHILYDDDDEQDMDEDDLRRAFRLYERKKHRDPKCPTKKDDEEGGEKKSEDSGASTTKNEAGKESKKSTDVADIAKALAAEVDAEVEREEKKQTEIGAKPKAPEKKERCDVCLYRDGHKGLNLLRCIKCQLSVHRDCYGLQTYTKNEFICWACESVGKEIPASIHYSNSAGKETKEMDASEQKESSNNEKASADSPLDKEDTDIKIVQQFRPTHCVLCNHNPHNDTAVHAMHPIYDNHGPRARQKAVKDKDGNIQLAWAHSLCAFMLSEHNVLYGVQANGTTHEGAEEDTRDQRSINPFLTNEFQIVEDDCDYGEAAPVHHFVYFTHVGEKKRRDTVVALKKIQDFQANKCFICDKSTVTGLEIPIQCLANDTHEYQNFRGTHIETLKKEECCTTPFHVGCGQWGVNNHHTRARRVFFFPGGENADPVKVAYCNIHAVDVTKKHRDKLEEKQREEEEKKREERKRQMGRRAQAGTVTQDEAPKKKFKKLKIKKKTS